MNFVYRIHSILECVDLLKKIKHWDQTCKFQSGNNADVLNLCAGLTSLCQKLQFRSVITRDDQIQPMRML
jgi:hypothetical protein